MTQSLRSIGVACLIALPGCAGIDAVLPQVTIPDADPVVEVSIPDTPRAPVTPVEPAPKALEALAVATAEPTAAEKAPAERPPAKPLPSPVKETPREPALPAAVAPARKVEEPLAAAKPAEAGLDVAGLKARLRDTPAIGVLAKLSLRSQVDDLMEAFRAHYAGTTQAGFAALHKPYDTLVTKALDLLQDGDPPLARSIAGSREVIWGILTDREKFNAVR